jgi:hypothetical protein
VPDVSEKRKHCFELMRHPRNREYFENILKTLAPGGIYGWIDMLETFTREEVEQALKEKDNGNS